jgi:hypothetical protein
MVYADKICVSQSFTAQNELNASAPQARSPKLIELWAIKDVKFVRVYLWIRRQ